jgi:hypothetical protein
MVTAVAAPAKSKVGVAAGDYIVGPVYDWALFLLPPVLALGLGFLISGTAFPNHEMQLAGHDFSWASLFIGVFIHAHLVAVFFRSHGNPQIRRLHPVRFLVVPVLLYAAMMLSYWVLIFVSVLVTFWDVYHSALQTFGFARMYDRKHSNDVNAGRRLDWWLNLLLYAGPIVGGATMLDHFEDFGDFDKFDDQISVLFTSVPAYMEGYQRYLTIALLVGGTVFVAWYVYRQWQLTRTGYRVAPLKVYLLASTGLVSIYCWGFNSFGEAFFVMNFFHALQYFGIVWAFEQRNMMRLFGVEDRRFGRALALVLFVVPIFAYGLWVEFLDAGIHWLWAITLLVSILHFWYDGFVWSVRRNQV